jgi:hypothetical protein
MSMASAVRVIEPPSFGFLAHAAGRQLGGKGDLELGEAFGARRLAQSYDAGLAALTQLAQLL